jgi:hypothetical protein
MIMMADEFKALDSWERQLARRAARQQRLVQLILRAFLGQGGPIPVADIIAGSPGGDAEGLHDALVALDDEDLIRVRAGQIDASMRYYLGLCSSRRPSPQGRLIPSRTGLTGATLGYPVLALLAPIGQVSVPLGHFER